MTSAAAPVMANEQVYLRREEAAELARVSVFLIDAWMKEPDFPVYRPSKRTVLIHRAEFIGWLATHRFPPGGPPTPIKKRGRK